MELNPIETASQGEAAFAVFKSEDENDWSHVEFVGNSYMVDTLTGIDTYSPKEFYEKFIGWLPIGEDLNIVERGELRIDMDKGYKFVPQGEIYQEDDERYNLCKAVWEKVDNDVIVGEGKVNVAIVRRPIKPPAPPLEDGAIYHAEDIYGEPKDTIVRIVNGLVLAIGASDPKDPRFYKIGEKIEMPANPEGGE